MEMFETQVSRKFGPKWIFESPANPKIVCLCYFSARCSGSIYHGFARPVCAFYFRHSSDSAMILDSRAAPARIGGLLRASLVCVQHRADCITDAHIDCRVIGTHVTAGHDSPLGSRAANVCVHARARQCAG